MTLRMPIPRILARPRLTLLLLFIASIGLPDRLLQPLQTRPVNAAATTFTRTADGLLLTNGAVSVRYDLRLGLVSLDWGSAGAIANAYASANLHRPNGIETLVTTELSRRTFEEQAVADELGRGITLVVSGEHPALGATLTQRFTVYDNRSFVLLRAEAGRGPSMGADAIAVGQIEVLAAGGGTDPGGSASVPGSDLRLYRAPFDNNGDFEVPAAASSPANVSFWLGGLFDAATGGGLIAGATESRTWKSAVYVDGPTRSISLFSGARSPRDTTEPEPRLGDRIASAEFLAGVYADHRDGLTDLMMAVARRDPPLPEPPLPPPLGWNPWYQYEFRADENIVHGITDTIAEQWAPHGYRYVNLDAGWNVMDGDWRANPERFPNGMEALASYIHQRGLLAGTYFIPFAVNSSLIDAAVPGTDLHFRDIVLRDDAGQPVPADVLMWEYVLDGSHPGTQAFLRTTAASIAADGFDFVKLDFLQVGTQEGMHWDPSATAMQAFHEGMKAVHEGFASAGRPIFLSAAIAPLYVQPYVHARRVGTDVNFGQAREAQNVALSWFTHLLYHRNDPDNVVVREDWFPDYSDGLARMHATMGALGGTLFILGDDPRQLSQERAALLTDPEVLALAAEGVAARPLDVGDTPAPVWWARLADGAIVLGVFNWDGDEASHTVSLARLGLSPGRAYTVTDLWEHTEAGSAVDSLSIELPPHSARLVRLGP
jgi:alpha-galactosidase